MRKSQQEFRIKGFERAKDEFGGALLKGNPKKKRPLDSKLPIHLTLRAKKSVLRLPKVFGKVEKIIREVAKKQGVKDYKDANVGNHLHLALKIRHVKDWAGFIRELTGRIALACKGVFGEKGFWMYRPHTRIIRGWQKAFKIVLNYIYLNQIEAEGFISRKEIKTLREYRALFDTA
jgi:hypothetical protein